MSEVPSEVTLIDLLAKTSLVSSAAVALVTSSFILLVKTASSAALILASLVNAVFCAVELAST